MERVLNPLPSLRTFWTLEYSEYLDHYSNVKDTSLGVKMDGKKKHPFLPPETDFPH